MLKKTINCSKRTRKRAQATCCSIFCAVRFITGFLLPEFAFYQTTALSTHGFKAKLLKDFPVKGQPRSWSVVIVAFYRLAFCAVSFIIGLLTG